MQLDTPPLSSLTSRQSSGGGVVLDPMVTDDSIILDLVESLQGDFPDCIAFDDDPFELFPTNGSTAAISPMTMH